MRKGLTTVLLLLTAVVVAGCGGASSKGDPSTGSSSAHALLVQTFDGHHTISSGVIKLELKIAPGGSSTITKPIELSFGGPFASRGPGKLPESDFTVSLAAQGEEGGLQVISVGGKGYITVAGQSYAMPASSLKSLASGLGSLASSGGASGSKSGAFAKLGIQPLDWLSDPRVVGHPKVNGAATTQIQANVDTAALLRDVSKLLGKARSLGGSAAASLPSSISAATQTSIAKALGSPRFELWTGTADKILRKLTVSATIPVTGQVRSALGGLTSATVTLDLSYSGLNRPQSITAPTNLKPYSVFKANVGKLLQEIEGGVVSGSVTGGTTGTGTGTVAGTTTVPSAGRKYTQCITGAAGDVAKMQRCASLIGAG